MKALGTLPSLRSSRNPLVSLGLAVIVIFAAYQAAQLVLAGDISQLMLVGLIFACGAVVIVILNDWHRGVYILLAWVVFEDLFRKYLGNNMAIFFGKDFLAIVLYLSFFVDRRKNIVASFKPPIFKFFMFFFWFGLIQMFNPGSNSIFYGILGMKVYFLYFPLIYVGYALIDKEEDVRRFFSFNAILILAVVGLGIVQSVLGPTFLNPSKLQDDIRELSTTYRTAPISGLVAYRPNSVFVSAGRLQDFLVLSWILSLGFGGYLLLRSRRGRLLAFLTIGVVAVGSIMSASRGVFMWSGGSAVIIIGGFLWGAPWRQGEALRIVRTIQRSILVGGLGLFVLLALFPSDVASRFAIYSETLSLSSPTSELVSRTRDYPLENLLKAFDYPRWPYGYGIGTSSLGVQYVARIMHAVPMGIGVENGWGQLILELGIVGLVLWIVLGVAVAFAAWKVTKSLKGTPWFPLSFTIFLYATLLMLPMSYVAFISYQDYIDNAYLWLLLGILFRLRTLPKTLQDAQANEVPSAAARQG
jgi:hypothetical protein